MIDLRDLRQRPEAYQRAAEQKNIRVSVKDFLRIDDERKTLQQSVDAKRAEQNATSKAMPGLKGKERQKQLSAMKELSAKLKEEENRLQQIEMEWKTMQLLLPTIPLPSVPIGKDESGNKEMKRWGKPGASAPAKDHVEIGEALGLFDINRGVKIAGARNYFLVGKGAELHLAVLRLAIDTLTKKGWKLFSPPLMASWDCLMGTGFFPGAEEQTYAVGAELERGKEIETDNLYLIGTSEVSVCSYHNNEVLPLAMLPTRYCGYSSCFRREAGTYGKDTKGLYRVHQFEKVEQVVLCEADEGKAMAMFEEIRMNAEEVLQILEMPYRVLDICTGDMGRGKVFMQDIETWMPSRGDYCETHSCSYLGDFQARRLNIKYIDRDGTKKFVHTLNNTCIASPRILIPLLETYQSTDGSVTIPSALRPYMGGKEKIVKI
jgi:seryl-tRNA synthetase